MDIQTRKLNIIEYLINLTDESVFKVLEEIVNESKASDAKTYIPFTKQELISRAKESNNDYLAGKTKDQNKLEEESKKW